MTETADTTDYFFRLSLFCPNLNKTAIFGGIGGFSHFGVPILLHDEAPFNGKNFFNQVG